jgi:hypothetical protein
MDSVLHHVSHTATKKAHKGDRGWVPWTDSHVCILSSDLMYLNICLKHIYLSGFVFLDPYEVGCILSKDNINLVKNLGLGGYGAQTLEQ